MHHLDQGGKQATNEDLFQEKAIITEILKKRHMGFNANSFAKKADQARQQSFMGKKNQTTRNAYASSDLSGQYSEGGASANENSASPVMQTKSKSLMNYQMKR